MTPLMQSNVVALNTDSVFADITTFLVSINNNKAGKYEGSALEYERDIKRFFKLMLGKELNELTVEDLYFLPKDVKRFQNHMSSTYKSATVNRNIASMKSLYNFFESNRYKFVDKNGETVWIKADQFNVNKIEKNDTESYGVFHDNEIKELIELAKTLSNGIRKSLAIELASVTSIRIQAIVDLSLSNIKKEGETWVIKVIDKDAVHEKPIRNDLYERLAENAFSDEKIFDMTARTLERDLKKLVEKMGLDPDRNLTFHSIKKYGINEVFKITGGNIMETATQGNHTSFETAMKHYMECNKDYSKMPCLLIGQDVDTSPLEELSHEELLNLIKNSGRGLQYELLNNLKKSRA